MPRLDEPRLLRIGGSPSEPHRVRELYIEVTDAGALHDSLAKRVLIEWGPEVYSYGRREFAVRDPNGYLVIFTELTNDPPTMNEPHDSDGPDGSL